MRKLQVLIVADSADDVELILRNLRHGGYDPTLERVETSEEMEAALERQKWDLVLSDYWMPHFSGLAAVEQLRAKDLDLPIILLSGGVGEETLVQALKAGANDYIMKPNMARLCPAIQRELADAEVRRARRQAEESAVAALKELADVRAALITQLEHKNTELVEAREAALQASQAKSEFLANMSHEIRTPLTSILGVLAMLDDGELSNEQSQLLGDAKESGDALLNIINDILDFSKIMAGKLVFVETDFDWWKTVKASIETVRNAVDRKKLKISLLIGSAIPQTVKGDPNRLRQVLTNLLTNAVKFTEKGEVSIAVTELAGSSETIVLRFAVTDTGIGISAEEKEQLFRPFAQIDSPINRSAVGSGLGLAIVQALVEQMGGTVGLESTPGVGSTFWFTARFRASEVATYEAASSGVDRATDRFPSTPQHHRRHVLVVEDNAVNRKVALWQLDRLGYAADAVSSGVQAVEAVGQAQYDLILMDCRMPHMDGYEASRRIRQSESSGQHIKIVAMTAHALAGDRQKCLAAGMDDYISKPVQIEDLATLLDRLLNDQGAVGTTATSNPILSQPSESVLDPVMMESLRAQVGLLPGLIDTVLDEIPEKLREIDQAVAHEDAERTAIEAHGLKGVAAIFGAYRMQECASGVEHAADSRSAHEVQSKMRLLRIECERVVRQLTIERATPRPSA